MESSPILYYYTQIYSIVFFNYLLLLACDQLAVLLLRDLCRGGRRRRRRRKLGTSPCCFRTFQVSRLNLGSKHLRIAGHQHIDPRRRRHLDTSTLHNRFGVHLKLHNIHRINLRRSCIDINVPLKRTYPTASPQLTRLPLSSPISGSILRAGSFIPSHSFLLSQPKDFRRLTSGHLIGRTHLVVVWINACPIFCQPYFVCIRYFRRKEENDGGTSQSRGRDSFRPALSLRHPHPASAASRI